MTARADVRQTAWCLRDREAASRVVAGRAGEAYGVSRRYSAYLLRVWHEGRAEGARWAARLEHLPCGDALLFTDHATLLAYLEEVTGADLPDCARDREGSQRAGEQDGEGQ